MVILSLKNVTPFAWQTGRQADGRIGYSGSWIGCTIYVQHPQVTSPNANYQCTTYTYLYNMLPSHCFRWSDYQCTEYVQYAKLYFCCHRVIRQQKYSRKLKGCCSLDQLETRYSFLLWLSRLMIQDIPTDKVLFCQKVDGQNRIRLFPPLNHFRSNQPFVIHSSATNPTNLTFSPRYDTFHHSNHIFW